MNRTDLRRLAELRLIEARVLLEPGCFEGSYYLAGYAVECAIEACFARKTDSFDFPDKRAVEKIWRHDLKELISAAGLAEDWDKELKSNRTFNGNWTVVKEWSEEKRYAIRIYLRAFLQVLILKKLSGAKRTTPGPRISMQYGTAGVVRSQTKSIA